MVNQNNTQTEEFLSKFLLKAKRKLSHSEDFQKPKQASKPTIPSSRYTFLELNRKEEYTELTSAIDRLLESNPNCTDPIFRLINHSKYDKLEASAKQKYILDLSSLYNQILKEKNII